MDFVLMTIVGLALIGDLAVARGPAGWAVAGATAIFGIVGYVVLKSSQQVRAELRRFDSIVDLPWDRLSEFANAKRGALVEASGKVVVRTPLMGPFSGQPAAFWYCRVEGQEPNGGWATLNESHSIDEFRLESGGGAVSVLPENAHVKLDGSPFVHDQPAAIGSLPLNLSEYLNQNKLPAWDPSKALKFIEWRVGDGDSVSVLGRVEPVPPGREVGAGIYAYDSEFWVSNLSPRKLFRPRGTDRYRLGAGLMLLAAAIGWGGGYVGLNAVGGLKGLGIGAAPQSSGSMSGGAVSAGD